MCTIQPQLECNNMIDKINRKNSQVVLPSYLYFLSDSYAVVLNNKFPVKLLYRSSCLISKFDSKPIYVTKRYWFKTVVFTYLFSFVIIRLNTTIPIESTKKHSSLFTILFCSLLWRGMLSKICHVTSLYVCDSCYN
jgi:hypothetical protein